MTCSVGNIDLDKVVNNIDSIVKEMRQSIASEMTGGKSVDIEDFNMNKEQGDFSVAEAKHQIMGTK
jgi:hypothetical protein